MQNRPGGPLNEKPLIIGGQAYDPLDPPKLSRGEDGTEQWIGGTPLQKNRPGGPLQQKPLVIDGKTYDPLDPPKSVLMPDGSRQWQGGKVTSDTRTAAENILEDN